MLKIIHNTTKNTFQWSGLDFSHNIIYPFLLPVTPKCGKAFSTENNT